MARSTRALTDGARILASPRAGRGRAAQRRGEAAEQLAVDALISEGARILGRRMRTACGEIDIVARCGGVVVFVEVKARPSLEAAAFAVSARQRVRLMACADALLAAHPDWGAGGLRFDVMVVDAQGAVGRIEDAIRDDG